VSVAFLILAHQGPAQIARLASRLSSTRTSVHLHIDRRTSIEVYRDIKAAIPEGPRLQFVPRIATPWASWGLVDATLAGLRNILKFQAPADHIVIMSGQCYPLRSPDRIADFFSTYPGRSFICSWVMPSNLYGPDGGMNRLRYWHMPIFRRRFRVPIPRQFPPEIRPHGGCQFSVLAREHAHNLLEFTTARPDIVQFFRHVWIPDEHYISTVLQNLCHNDIINENLWHVEWTHGAKHPGTLAMDDFPQLATAAINSSASGGRARAKLFARKFDLAAQPKLFDLIDRKLLCAEG
jgi:hypothetical protein